jgi:solute carrier family 25 protein 16
MTSWFWEADKTARAPVQQGMPSAIINNAPRPSILKDESRKMDEVRQTRPAIYPTDDEAVELQKKLASCSTDNDSISREKKKPHKQSFEYIWRTGVAGGLAGSAVCSFPKILYAMLKL